MAASMTVCGTFTQDWVGDQHIPVSPQPSGQPGHHLPRQHLLEEREQQNGDVISIKQEFQGEGEAEDDALLAPRKPWYRQRSLQLVLAGYASIAFLMNFLEELTPIFASAPYTSVSPFSYLGHQMAILSRGHAQHSPVSAFLVVSQRSPCPSSPARPTPQFADT